MNSNRTVTANFAAIPSNCTYAISPTLRSHGFEAETGEVDVNVTAGSGCNWSGKSNAGWLTIASGGSGTGSGTLAYLVTANPDPGERTGTLTIAGQTFTVTQARSQKEGVAPISLPPVSTNWRISGLHLCSANEGWAVGEDVNHSRGLLLHYIRYGATCRENCTTQVTPPPVSLDWYLSGVYFASCQEGWAVGRDEANKRGVLLHHFNGAWTSVPVPTVSPDWELYAVHFLSTNEGWAAGYDRAGGKGVMLHYLDGIWTAGSEEGGTGGGISPGPLTLPSGSVTNHVYFLSSDEGWAVGEADNKGLILHYINGAWWADMGPPEVSGSWGLSWAHFTSSQEGWAVGTDHENKRGVLLHYANGTWRPVGPPPVSADWELNKVHFSSSSRGWAVGRNNANNRPLFLRYSNGTWEAEGLDISSNSEMTGVKCICSNTWAMGTDLGTNTGEAVEYT